jgi:hypothetical protein
LLSRFSEIPLEFQPGLGAIRDEAGLISGGAGIPDSNSAGKSSGNSVVSASRSHCPLATSRVL